MKVSNIIIITVLVLIVIIIIAVHCDLLIER